MDFKDNNIQDKENLSKLYDSSLNNYQNCLKIIQRLRKDTNNMNTKLAISQRQSMPSNIKTSNNLAQIKMMNISYDVKNLYGNSREQQINIIKPVHTNRGKYVQNPFISSISGQYFNNSYNNEINNKINSYNNNANSFNLKNVDNSNPNFGEIIQWTITVTNNGPDGSDDVLVIDEAHQLGQTNLGPIAVKTLLDPMIQKKYEMSFVFCTLRSQPL